MFCIYSQTDIHMQDNPSYAAVVMSAVKGWFKTHYIWYTCTLITMCHHNTVSI